MIPYNFFSLMRQVPFVPASLPQLNAGAFQIWSALSGEKQILFPHRPLPSEWRVDFELTAVGQCALNITFPVHSPERGPNMIILSITYAELAEQLGVSIDGARMRAKRARWPKVKAMTVPCAWACGVSMGETPSFN